MKTLAIEYPGALLAAWGTTEEAFEREARLALAMKPFFPEVEDAANGSRRR